MKSLFEPLLHANAKAFAILCAILFVGMLGWGAYTEYAARQADARAQEEAQSRSNAPLPIFPEIEPIGLLAYVESQAATGTEDAHLPIDLFRCPIDSSGNVVRPGAELPPETPLGQTTPGENEPEVSPDVQILIDQAQDTLGLWSNPGGQGTRSHGDNDPQWGNRPPPRNHELVYKGVFKRSDGSVAALVTDKGNNESRFLKAGDEFGGATVVEGDTDKLRLRLEDGSEHDLVRGGEPVITGQFPPPPNTDTPRQRLRRLPTESEIKEIEKRDPDLARRIREAIRRQNAQKEQKGGN